MRIAISNGRFTAEVETRGAELRRLYDGAMRDEILWTGDPAVWSGTAPVLFPVVGRMLNGGYRYRGRTYSMPKHGFARSREFQVIRQGANSLTLEQGDDAQTREMYPFAFRLFLEFTLNAHGLRVSYEVRNPGPEELWFTLGSHPGIRLPAGGGPYRVEFDRPQTLQVFQLEGELLGAQGRPCLKGERVIPLAPGLFDHDALIFKNIEAESLAVCDADGKRVIRIGTGGAPHLGIWAKPGAPYVCIEPWYGYDDATDSDGELTRKPGMCCLAAGGVFTTAYTIETSCLPEA